MNEYVVLVFTKKEFSDIYDLIKSLQDINTKEAVLGIRAFENALEKGASLRGSTVSFD